MSGRALDALYEWEPPQRPLVTYGILGLCLLITIPTLVRPELYAVFGGIEPRRYPWQLFTAAFEHGWPVLAGLFLGMSRSFDVGDLIESSGHLGRVREIDLRQVWIRSADGPDIFIPSAQIFRNVLTNYTRDGLRRGEFVVGVDYADPIDDACELLLEETRKMDGVLEQPAPAVRVSDFVAQYCEIKVLFWIDTDSGPGLSEVRSSVMAACLRALRAGGYTLSSDVSTAVSVSNVDGGAAQRSGERRGNG